MILLKEDDTPLNTKNNVSRQTLNQGLQTDTVDLTASKIRTQQNDPSDNFQINWTEEYRKAKNPTDARDLIQRFLKSFGFKNYDESKFNNFVQINLHSLWLECNSYGLSKDNPFFLFLNNYLRDSKTTIDVFFDQNKWDLLHNCVAQGIIEKNQLTFKSETKKQIRILFNPNLWNISNISDIKFCIELYAFLVDTDLNTFIKNRYVKAAFAKPVEKAQRTPGQYTQFAEGDMNDPTNIIGLLKCLFMTDYIEELDANKLAINDATSRLDSNNHSKIDDICNQIASIKKDSSKDLISGPLKSVDLIEHQYKLLHENVQLSDTALNGQKQKTDTDDNNKYQSTNIWKSAQPSKNTSSTNNNTIDNYFRRKLSNNNTYKDIIQLIKDKLGVVNRNDTKKALEALLQFYKINNNL